MNAGLMAKTKEIAKGYINNVLFVDDEITFLDDEKYSYRSGDGCRNILNGCQVTQALACQKISSSFYMYSSIDGRDNILNLIDNSDVLVLDWKFIFSEEKTSDEAVDIHKDDGEEDVGEEDVDDDSGRGRHALELLKEILSKTYSNPKLIIIYTGEINPEGIVDDLETLPNGHCENYRWLSDDESVCISIYFKIGLKNTHAPKIVKERTVDYPELPELIIDEFSRLHCGLISNAILKSISAIRHNTNKLLNSFSKRLDPAFVAHRAMCSNPDDAGELLQVTIADAFNAVLSYDDIPKVVDSDSVENWINSNSWLDTQTIKINKKEIAIDRCGLIDWQKQGYSQFFINKYNETHDQELSDKKLEIYDRNGKFKKDSVCCFCPEHSKAERIHEDFSILTHHKSIFLSNGFLPMLTLGTVLKKDSESFLLCIQQKCDSVRLKPDESRNFLFLNLETIPEGDKAFDLLYKDGNETTRLKICNNSCHQLQVIQFKDFEGRGFVEASSVSNKLVFKDSFENELLWLFDLKESHAQKIANEFAATLSRVGIDQSEWLRRN